jgi:hypothetical protein
VNKETQTAENLYYMDINPQAAPLSRREPAHPTTTTVPDSPDPIDPDISSTHVQAVATLNNTSTGVAESGAGSRTPKYLFASAAQLLDICQKEDLTIAQVIWENELAFRSPVEIKRGLMKRESWSHT